MPVRVGVVPTECQPRKVLDMLYMMHQICGIGFAADLTVPMIFQENCGGKFTPFPADIKRMNVAGSDQTQQPLEETISHKQNKKRP